MNDYVATYRIDLGLHRLVVRAKSRKLAMSRALKVAPVGGVLTNIRQKTPVQRRLVFPFAGGAALK